MSNPFFDHPILNSPYACPQRHWELDPDGQPTQRVIETRRRAEFITPIAKPKKRKRLAVQDERVFDEGKQFSTTAQQYDSISIINQVRQAVDAWRALPNSNQWQVTPETARLLKHWRHHNFSGVRPFFCQVEAAETAIWLTEVAPQTKSGKLLLEHLASANKDADMACNKITAAITRQFLGERPIKALLDAYNPTGSTAHVRFNTSKTDRWETSSKHCHLNWVILDSDWEAEFCRVAESHPKVLAYVKNHNLGWKCPTALAPSCAHTVPTLWC